MNMNLKAIYFCSTSARRWGKGLTIAEAKKHAGITTQKPNCQFYVQAAILNDPTEAELINLKNCITANQIEGSPEYYKHERTKEDADMINAKHVGWLLIEKNF